MPEHFIEHVANGVVRLTTDLYRFYIVNDDATLVYLRHDAITEQQGFDTVPPGHYPSVTYVIDTGWPKGEGFNQWLTQQLSMKEAERYRDERGGVGRIVHAAIDLVNKGHELVWPQDITIADETFVMTIEQWRMVWGFLRWLDRIQGKILASEQIVATEMPGGVIVMGTLDFVIQADSGLLHASANTKNPKPSGHTVICVVDAKSSKAAFPSHCGQSEVYRRGYGADYSGVLALGSKNLAGYQWKLVLKKQQKSFQSRFMSAYGHWHETEGHREPRVIEMPERLSLRTLQPKPEEADAA